MEPEKKHERKKMARMKRYTLKHGTLVGFQAYVFGEQRPYKSGYYLEHRDKILSSY